MLKKSKPLNPTLEDAQYIVLLGNYPEAPEGDAPVPSKANTREKRKPSSSQKLVFWSPSKCCLYLAQSEEHQLRDLQINFSMYIAQNTIQSPKGTNSQIHGKKQRSLENLYVELKKPEGKGHMLYVFISVKCSDWAKPHPQKVDQQLWAGAGGKKKIEVITY